MSKIFPGLFLALLPGLIFAQEQQFAFALPELEGRISLGIYDPAGKLVRVLAAAADEKAFKVGLNGLIATWDGKDDSGKKLPSGKYRVSGFVVGDGVRAEGVAYHFNDWIESDDSPEISGLGAVVPGEAGAFLLFGFKPARDVDGPVDAMLWRFEESAGLRVIDRLPYKAAFLAADATQAAIGDSNGGKLHLFNLSKPGGPPLTRETAGVTYWTGAFWRDHLYLQPSTPEAREIDRFDRALAPQGKITAPQWFQGIDANPAALLGRIPGEVWIYDGEKFEKIPLEELPERFTLSAGPEKTFWIAGRNGAEVVARQHGFDGTLLREMKITEDFAETVHIFASKTSMSFYLLLQSPRWDRQTLRGYRPAAQSAAPAADGAQVDWEVFLDKTIENSRRFGFVDGKLVANAGDTAQENARTITLPPNTLRARAATLTLKAVRGPSGIWLATSDGLPLLFIAPRSSASRFITRPGDAADSLAVFAGDSVVVAEYLVTGLQNIAGIAAGEIEIP